MRYITNAYTSREIDRISIEEFKMPSMVLMERAAYETASIIRQGHNHDDRIAAVCGRGNNGGDAIAAARILHEFGYDTSIYLSCEADRLSEQSSLQYKIAIKCGVKVAARDSLNEYSVIIDGLYGIGLDRDISGPLCNLIEEMNSSHARIYAVDIPSGIHAATGRVMGTAVQADVTVTFGYEKSGLVLYPGCEYAGKIITADIGFPQIAAVSANLDLFAYEHGDLRLLPKRNRQSNKGTYGRVLVIAGSRGMCGASYLSAKAAYRTGCGLVKIVTPEANRSILQTQLPEALLSVDEDISTQIDWADAIVLGPGLGQGETAKQLVNKTLDYATVPVVIDADALNIIAADGLYDKVIKRQDTILTPHLKEMSRLWKCSVDEIKEDVISYAKDNSSENVIYVLKDARTIISNGINTCINTSGNDGMSTAGSGDVLTGIIASLLAQGMDCFGAASLGAYIHGMAGDRAAQELGRRSMIASDIIDSIGSILTNE